jgi:uncharacterized membrane protein YoaT (DUF817 family)
MTKENSIHLVSFLATAVAIYTLFEYTYVLFVVLALCSVGVLYNSQRHEKHLFFTLLCLGYLVEIMCTARGVWMYPHADVLNIPVWIAFMWAIGAIGSIRLLAHILYVTKPY